jgi:hypothetical protein
MYEKETRSLPNYALLKSAYDCVDLRKDGVLDINEWVKAFSTIKVFLP